MFYISILFTILLFYFKNLSLKEANSYLVFNGHMKLNIKRLVLVLHCFACTLSHSELEKNITNMQFFCFFFVFFLFLFFFGGGGG